jgi:capsular exopolysaccharide synthesis family protein
MNDSRNDTIRDLLRTLRTNAWLVALVTLVFVAGAIVYSSRQDKVYESEASLQFTDPNEDFRFLGTPAGTTQSPEQRATVAAKRINSPEISRRAAEELRKTGGIPPNSGVTALPEARSNLVVVRGRGPTGKDSARIANAYAKAAFDQIVDDVKQRIETASESLNRTIRRLRRQDRLDRYSAGIYRERVSRLEAVRGLTAPVELVSSASAPSLPVSPRPVRTGILAGILGFTLSLLLAFLRSALDRRFRNARDISELLSMPLVGFVRDETLGRTVTGDKRTLDERDLEGFRIARRNLDFLDVDRPPRCIVVTSALPEEGKSTVALGISLVAASAGQRVLLVEGDLRRPTLAERLGVEPTPGLSDYLAGHAAPSEVVRSIELPAPSSLNGDSATEAARLAVIPAGQPTAHATEMLASQRFKDFLAEVRQAYEVVIIDTSPLLPVADTLELAPEADAIVLCVRSGQTTRDQARAAASSLEHLPDRPSGVIVTGLKPSDELDYGYYSYAYAYSAR